MTKDQENKMREEMCAEYERILTGFRQPKKKVADMTAAFKDGLLSYRNRMIATGDLKLEE